MAQAIAKRGQPLDDGARLAIEELAGLGRLEAPARAAVDEAQAEVALEPAQLLAHGGLRDEVEAGRAREAARLDEITEGLERLNSH